MSRIPTIHSLALLVVLHHLIYSGEVFRIDGRRIFVSTRRYSLELLDGCIVRIKNRLTGEDYTAEGDPSEILGRLPTGLSSVRGSPNYGAVELARRMHQHIYGHEPNSELAEFPTQHKPFERSKVSVERLGKNRLRVTYEGLSDGRKAPNKHAEQVFRDRMYTFPSESYELELTLEPGTGDLTIKPTASSRYPGICGVAYSLANISDRVHLLRCMYTGCEELGAEHPERAEGTRWPSQWTVQLIIGKADKGSFAVWAQDDRAITKYLHLRHYDRKWALSFESLTDAPFGDKWRVEGVEWRFNTFKDDWREAAERYKRWMRKAYKLIPLEKRRPRWLKNIRAVCWSRLGDEAERELASKIPASKVAIINVPPFEGQGRYPSVQWKPNYPMNDPERFKIKAEYRRKVQSAKKLGFRVITWMPFTYTDASHPLSARFWHARVIDYFEDHTRRSLKEVRIHPGYREFGRLWLRWMGDVLDEFNVDGLYFDVCPLDGTNLNGRIDGLTVTQGTVKLLNDFRRKFPDKALTGEYFSELVAGKYDFANATYIGHYGMNASRLRTRRAHPLLQYLFGDYVVLSTWWPGSGERFHLALDQEEASGYLPSICLGDASQDAGSEARLRLKRLRFFIKHNLRNYWPESWHPEVKSYWKGKDGKFYAFVNDRGSRFLELTSLEGIEGATIYWRIKGATKVPIHGGLPDWLGYSDDHAIGLNPDHTYIYLGEHRRNDVNITRIPDGTYLANTRTYPIATIVEVKSLGEGSVTGSLYFITDGSIRRVMTQSEDIILAERRGGEVEVTTPVTLAFIRSELPELNPALELTALKPFFSRFLDEEARPEKTPRNYFRMSTRKNKDQSLMHFLSLGDFHPEKAEYLVRVPDQPRLSLRVTVTVSASAMNRKKFYLLINGAEKLKVTGKPGETFSGSIPLEEYSGRSILISLYARRPTPDNYTGPHLWHISVESQ